MLKSGSIYKYNFGLLFLFLTLILSAFSGAATLTISVSLPDGKPVQNAEVILERIYPPESEIKIGKTNSQGRTKVRFDDNDSAKSNRGYGILQFAVIKEDYRWEKSPIYIWEKDKSWQDKMSKEIGREREHLVVEMKDEIQWDVKLSRAVKKIITIADETGNPIKKCKMQLRKDFFDDLSGEWMNFTSPVIYETDDNGEFAVNSEYGRNYNLSAEDDEYISESNRYTTIQGINFLFSPQVELLKFVFVENHKEKLNVFVREDDTKKPIRDARICLKTSYGDWVSTTCVAKTNDEGISTPVDFYPKKTKMIGVTADEYQEQWIDAERFSSDTPIEFKLKKIK